jgi:hypothetical protein
VWTDSAQATAKQIKIVSTNTKIKYMELNGNSFFISQEDSLRFNQLSGKTVKGYFVKDTLRQIEVNGNAKAIYFLKNDKKKFVGVNQTECKDITVRFDSKGKADRVSFLTKPTAKITPISDVDLKAMKLKGFIWLENLKPKSAKEITDCNINR